MRLNKFLSQSGIASRRKSDELIKMATTEVNGVLCFDPAYDVKKSDIVKYDGKKISIIEKKIVIMLYKPKNVISTVSDTHDRKTVMDLIPKNIHLNPVGRLDKNTTGLLLLTNDGELKRKLELPSNGFVRKYRVRANGVHDQPSLDKLRKGISINNEKFRPMEVELDRINGANVWYDVFLKEGRNREIRRAFAQINMNVNRLIRISFAGFELGSLSKGEIVEVPQNIVKKDFKL